MRTAVLTAAVAALSSVVLTGCPLACGGWDGEGDRVYTRGQDMVVVCGNGGVSGSIAGADVEGRLFNDAIIDGATGGLAYDFAPADGWTEITLDQVGLDHADVLCQDLTTRGWWTMVDDTVPTATALVKPAEDPSACDARNGLDGIGSCDDVILLCPDGRAVVKTAVAPATEPTGYTLAGGRLDVAGLAGTYRANGSFTTYAFSSATKVTWTAHAPQTLGLSCE